MHFVGGMSTSTEAKDSIEQVREILVGSLQRDLERRLVRTEAHLSARSTEIQQETRRRTDVIEAHLRKELKVLSARLDGELAEFKDGLRAIDQRVSRLEEALSRAQHELRGEILEQAKSFLDELQTTRTELTEALERELASFEIEPGSMEREEPEGRGHEYAESHSE
jgi:hypothetical protein